MLSKTSATRGSFDHFTRGLFLKKNFFGRYSALICLGLDFTGR